MPTMFDKPIPTTTVVTADEIAAIGSPTARGYEALPVPSSARVGQPQAHDFCTGSVGCSEQVFVLAATVNPQVLLAWYDQHMGRTSRGWRDWQACFPGMTNDGSPSFAERNWNKPGGLVLRLYLFASDADQPGPYVRITRGVERLCGDG
jgi:hypothetical protein